MISSGALKIDTGIAVDEGLFADDHGIDESGLGRGPKGVDFGEDAAVNAGPPELYATSRKACKQLHVFSFNRSEGGDSVRGQITLIIESSRITEIAGQL
ncbi:MAG: hypothetical protein WBV69_11565 [Candidatus Sulfotelmatobacter sp.]